MTSDRARGNGATKFPRATPLSRDLRDSIKNRRNELFVVNHAGASAHGVDDVPLHRDLIKVCIEILVLEFVLRETKQIFFARNSRSWILCTLAKIEKVPEN